MFNLGTLLVHQGDPQAAIEHLEKVTKLHLGLGRGALRPWAPPCFSASVTARRSTPSTMPSKFGSAYPEAEFNRGNAYAMRGLDDNGTMDYYELDQAVQAYKKAIQKRPGYPAALYNLGMVYKRMHVVPKV